MQIDLTESEYRTLLEALKREELFALNDASRRRYRVMRDNLRVRWERAADEAQPIPEPK